KAAAAPGLPRHPPERRLDIRKQTAKRNQQSFGPPPATASAPLASRSPAEPKAGSTALCLRLSFALSRADSGPESPSCKLAIPLRLLPQSGRATENYKPPHGFVEPLLVHRTARRARRRFAESERSACRRKE